MAERAGFFSRKNGELNPERCGLKSDFSIIQSMKPRENKLVEQFDYRKCGCRSAKLGYDCRKAPVLCYMWGVLYIYIYVYLDIIYISIHRTHTHTYIYIYIGW